MKQQRIERKTTETLRGNTNQAMKLSKGVCGNSANI